MPSRLARPRSRPNGSPGGGSPWGRVPPCCGGTSNTGSWRSPFGSSCSSSWARLACNGSHTSSLRRQSSRRGGAAPSSRLPPATPAVSTRCRSGRVTSPRTHSPSLTISAWAWLATSWRRASRAGRLPSSTRGASGSNASATGRAASRPRRSSSIGSGPSRPGSCSPCQRSTRAALRPAAAISGSTMRMSRVSSNSRSRAVSGARALPASTAAIPPSRRPAVPPRADAGRSPPDLAVAVAQHRPQEEGRGEASPHEPGGIAEGRGQHLHPEQHREREQGNAAIAAQEGFDRVVADAQHLGKHQGHGPHRRSAQGGGQAHRQLPQPALQPRIAAQRQQAEQEPRHQARHHPSPR